MKFFSYRSFYFALFFSTVTLMGISVACRKKKDTLAIIHVKNMANESVSGAKVILYGKSTTGQPTNVTLFDTSYTGADGRASFDFNDEYQLGQAGVAIVNIKASFNGLSGDGIIKIVEETTSEETVFIK